MLVDYPDSRSAFERVRGAGARPGRGAGARPGRGAGARPAPTVGEMVGTFKSLCVHDWLKQIKEKNIHAVGKFWQRNYYEHIIRNENELNKIREYIQNNPLNWQLDRENPEKIGSSELESEIFAHRAEADNL